MPAPIIAENYTAPKIIRKTRQVGRTMYVYEDTIKPEDKDIYAKLIALRSEKGVLWLQYEGFDSIRLVVREAIRIMPKTQQIRAFEKQEELCIDIRKHKREMNCQFWDVGDNWRN